MTEQTITSPNAAELKGNKRKSLLRTATFACLAVVFTAAWVVFPQADGPWLDMLFSWGALFWVYLVVFECLRFRAIGKMVDA